jgi:excisionase family DNA binding protein
VPGAAFERWDGQISVGDEEEAAKMGQLITVEDAAKLLSCSPAAVRKWLYQKRLRAVKIGRLTRLQLEDVERVSSAGFEAEGTRGATHSPVHGQVSTRQKG